MIVVIYPVNFGIESDRNSEAGHLDNDVILEVHSAGSYDNIGIQVSKQQATQIHDRLDRLFSLCKHLRMHSNPKSLRYQLE